MQNIHVRRYKDAHQFQGSVEPEDRSWCIFIDKNGHATFWRRGELEITDEMRANPNMGEIISHEIFYDVESVTLPSAAEALAAEGLPPASL